MTTTRHFRCPSRLLIPLFLAAFVTTGCQTTVGNYFANRGRDLGECFLLQTGIGLGLGAHVNAAGLLHAGVGCSIYSPLLSIGVVYGTHRPSRDYGHSALHIAFEWESGVPIAFVESSSLHDSHSGNGEFETHHSCWGILPGLLSWHEEGMEWTWIWAPESGHDKWQQGVWRREALPEEIRAEREIIWSRLHLFDIEAGVFVGIIGARAGFSPGEFVDFLLGWVGVDIAGDDRPVKTEVSIKEVIQRWRGGEGGGEDL